jgi:hypothetical protein
MLNVGFGEESVLLVTIRIIGIEVTVKGITSLVRARSGGGAFEHHPGPGNPALR